MLNQLNSGLQQMIHERGQIDPREVDVRFDAPTREILQRTIRPVINLFLYELTENTDLRQNSFQSNRENGHVERRLAPRRVDLHYMVSVLTSSVHDEYLLLWRVLAVLLKHHEIPDEVLSDELKSINVPFVTRAAQPDDMGRLTEIWSGLGVEPRPSIVYVVTAPLDLDITIRSPLVLTRSIQYKHLHASTEAEKIHHIGGTIRDSAGNPISGASVSVEGTLAGSIVTDSSGQYVLANVSEGALTVGVMSPEGKTVTSTFEVPGASYDIVVK